jgi:hypothetical protein
MRKIGLVAAFVVVFSSAFEQAGHDASSQEPMDGATDDDATGAYVDGANEAIRALQAGLVEALTSEMKEGGPSSAVHLCRDEAQAITAKVSRENGIDAGRTSHRLRNPQNAPPPWAEDVVRESAGRKTNDVGPHVIDLGDRIGVLKPVNTLGLCTNCHGNPDAIAADVKQALAEAYLEDKAVGFAVGDLRGWMWAEVPKKPNKK